MTNKACLLTSHFRSFLFFAYFALLIPGTMWAGGLQINYQGLRQSGMANAGVGLALDASSVFINPGALSMNYQGGILLGSSVLVPRIVFVEPGVDTKFDTTERQVLTPIYLYAAFKSKVGSTFEKFTFGISLNNPFGGRVKWEEGWIGRIISQEFSLNTFFLQPTISYQLTENIGFGAGLSFGFTSLLSIRYFKNSDGIEGTVQYTGTDTGIGLNLGLFAQVTPEFSLGISYRSRIKVNISDGLAQFGVPDLQQDDFPNQTFTTNFRLPSVFNIGLGYKPDPRTQIAFDLNFTGWQVYDRVDLVLPDPALVGRTFPNKNYVNSFSARVGGEYAMTEALLLRVGANYDSTPVSQEKVSPEYPDANRIGLSVGLGYRPTGKITIDASGGYDFIGKRGDSFLDARFSGTYTFSNASFGIGVGYLF